MRPPKKRADSTGVETVLATGLRKRLRPGGGVGDRWCDPTAWNGKNDLSGTVHDIDREAVGHSEGHMGPGRSPFNEDLSQPQRNLMGYLDARQVQAPGILYTPKFRTNVKVMVGHDHNPS